MDLYVEGVDTEIAILLAKKLPKVLRPFFKKSTNHRRSGDEFDDLPRRPHSDCEFITLTPSGNQYGNLWGFASFNNLYIEHWWDQKTEEVSPWFLSANISEDRCDRVFLGTPEEMVTFLVALKLTGEFPVGPCDYHQMQIAHRKFGNVVINSKWWSQKEGQEWLKQNPSTK